jgi:two-component system, LytTR family, sensor kinase
MTVSVRDNFFPEPTRASWRRIFFGHPTYWACQIMIWGGLLLLTLLMEISWSFHMPHERWLVHNGLLCLFSLVASHLLRIAFFLLGWNRVTLVGLVVRASIPILVLAFAEVLAVHHVSRLIIERWTVQDWDTAEPDGPPEQAQRPPLQFKVPPPEPGLLPRAAPFEYASCAVSLIAWAAAYLGYQYQQQYRLAQIDRARLDAAVKDAELRALRSQVNPHFLFNSLNTVRALIDEDPVKAREAVTRLAELLRAALATSQSNVVPLSVELQTVASYLALEKLRFENRLQFKLNVDPNSLDILVPPFLLQSLVENAFKHGVYNNSGGGEIACVIQPNGSTLRLSVRNPGKLLPGKNASGSGLTNARTRLDLIYSGAASLDVSQVATNEVEATVVLPRKLNRSAYDRFDR